MVPGFLPAEIPGRRKVEIELEELSLDLFAKGVIHRSHVTKSTPLGIKTGRYETQGISLSKPDFLVPTLGKRKEDVGS